MNIFLKPSTLLILSIFSFFSFKSADLKSDPVLSILGKTFEDTEISESELGQLEKIDMNAAFVEKGYVISSYSFVYVTDGQIQEVNGESELFGEEVKTALNSFEVGQKFSIEKINVKAPTGMPIKMPAFSFKVVD